jgi:hypothetical protein
MKHFKLILLVSITTLLASCSSFLHPKIDPYVVSPIETGPNQYIVVARASDYAGGEPLIRQLALSKASKHCSKEKNNLQVVEIQNGRWSKGATIDVFFKCLTDIEKDIIYSESVTSRYSVPKKGIKIYKPELIKNLEGEWFKYAETVSEDYYLLSNIYETLNKTKEVWVLYDLKKSSKYGHGSIKVLYEHQCSNELVQGRTRAVKSVSFDGPMGYGNVVQAIHASKNWQTIEPYTMSDERQNIVCN